MNINPLGAGNAGAAGAPATSGAAERAVQETKVVQSASSMSAYKNVEDLRKAEMRGEKHTVSDEQVVKALEKAIKAMQGKSTTLEFSIHEQTRQIAVKVLDKESGEIIREVPPEKTLDFVAKLWEMAGILVDERG